MVRQVGRCTPKLEGQPHYLYMLPDKPLKVGGKKPHILMSYYRVPCYSKGNI